MREIARQVGIQPASIYAHFASKEEILWFAYRSALDILGAMQAKALDDDAAGSGDVERSLRAFVRAHVRFHAQHSRVARIANSQMSSLSERHYAEATAWRDAYESSLYELVCEAASSGLIHITDVKIHVYAILQLGMGVATWYRPDGEWTVDEVVDRYEAITLRILGLPAVDRTID